MKTTYIIGSLLVIALFTLGLTSLAIGEERPEIASFEQAKNIAIKEGVEIMEDTIIQAPDGAWYPITVKCHVYKIGGIGELGWWTFYTIKYYPDFNNIVIVVYKPEFGCLVVFRQDTDLGGQKLFSCYIEQNHSTIVWGFVYNEEAIANGLVKLFLRPMKELITNSRWSFTPTEEMRQDCWPIGPQEESK